MGGHALCEGGVFLAVVTGVLTGFKTKMFVVSLGEAEYYTYS